MNQSDILKVEITNGRLVISIGIETLQWASRPENGGPIIGGKVDGRKRREFARDVRNEMMREDGIGNTPLNTFLDEMMTKAADFGSAAITPS